MTLTTLDKDDKCTLAAAPAQEATRGTNPHALLVAVQREQLAVVHWHAAVKIKPHNVSIRSSYVQTNNSSYDQVALRVTDHVQGWTIVHAARKGSEVGDPLEAHGSAVLVLCDLVLVPDKDTSGRANGDGQGWGKA